MKVVIIVGLDLQSESANFIEKLDKNVESTLISLIDEEEGINEEGVKSWKINKRGGGNKLGQVAKVKSIKKI